MLRRAERENALFRPRFLFVATCAAKSGVEAMLGECLLEALGLPDVRMDQ